MTAGTSAPTIPIVLPANQPDARFYAGGDAIAEFRGTGPAEPFTPEDWIGSSTAVRGQEPVGRTVLANGVPLVDAIRTDPEGWLGAEHVARFGADPMLLVKLLDAGERLPVHAHPSDGFAAEHLGAAHGKAEAWYVLTGGTVWVGLRERVERGTLENLMASQDREALLALLNPVAVQPGDSVLVPPGTLHAIGAGLLIVEVQQPEDQSILIEWDGYAIDGRAEGHLGLGFDVALGAVDLDAVSLEDPAVFAGIVHRASSSGSALVPGADSWFRLDHAADGTGFPAGFAIVIGEHGSLDLHTDGGVVEIERGVTVLVPAAAGELQFSARATDGRQGTAGRALVARPPRP
jgi:mannose-6-phosphate isomerase